MTTMMRIDDVTIATGLGRTTIYKLVGEGAVPASDQISARAVGWRSDDVAAWIDSRMRTPRLQSLAKPAVSGIGSLSAAQ